MVESADEPAGTRPTPPALAEMVRADGRRGPGRRRGRGPEPRPARPAGRTGDCHLDGAGCRIDGVGFGQPVRAGDLAAPPGGGLGHPGGPPVARRHRRLGTVGRGAGFLVRIQPAAGQLTRTTVPDLLSGGPVYLLAGSDRVVIRPLDNVAGYLVVDGKPARQLSPLLNQGPILAGPSAQPAVDAAQRRP